MKRFLLVVGLLGLAGSALAAGGPSQVMTTPTSDMAFETPSSSTHTISTTTATQFDHIPNVVQSRTGGRLCNLDATYKVFCGFTSSVAASVSSANMGEPWAPGECKNVNIGQAVSGYCLGEANASQSSVGVLWRQFK